MRTYSIVLYLPARNTYIRALCMQFVRSTCTGFICSLGGAEGTRCGVSFIILRTETKEALDHTICLLAAQLIAIGCQ